MKRKLLNTLGALGLWAGSASADGQVLPVAAVDEPSPMVVNRVDFDNGGATTSVRSGVYGGATLYLLQARFETNPAFATFAINAAGAQVISQQDFRYNLDGAPSFHVGWRNDTGLGGRVRYFEFAQGATEGGTVPDDVAIVPANPLGIIPTNASFVASGSLAATHSDLNIHTWDGEVTKHWDVDCWTLIAAAGLRYGHLSQNYRASVEPPANAADPRFTLASGHNFNGAGPTIALDSKRQLGSYFALYANARASLLFGTGKHSVYLNAQEGADTVVQERHTRQADLLPIGEVEIGLEAHRQVGYFAALLQVGFVGQTYLGAGNAANVSSAIPSFGTTGAAIDNTSNLGMVGLTVRLGIGF